MIDYGVGFGAHIAHMRYSHQRGKEISCDNSSCDSRIHLHQGPMTPAQIRAELDARNMSIRDLADAAGIHPNYLAKSLGKQGRRITVEEMRAIEEVLAPEDLKDRLRTIPLLGKVPAGKPQEAVQQGGRRIPAPDPETPPNAYALIVSGDSMDLIVPDGTILIIDPDDKSLWPDRRYVVKTEDTHEATFKEFQADPARLVPCSSNDEHKDILLGSEPIVILGRVYSYHLKDAHLPRRARG